MEAQKLRSGIYWIGVRDADLRIFDIIMKTDYGTTYNSYLIKGEKNILIDTVKVGFYNEYINKIKEQIGSEEIHYIISNHTEPDHSGSIKNLLIEYPNAQVVCSKPASMYLNAMLNESFNCKTVTDGEELVLGDKRFKFISAPFLHWPDTIFTYLEDEKVLFTGDVFGCHYCSKNDTLFDTEAGDFSDAFRYYFEVIMGPFKEHVIKAMDKIKDYTIEMVCPSHGPMLISTIQENIDKYMDWSISSIAKRDKKYILIAYVSAYGYTRTIAEELYKEILANSEFDVELIDISERDIMELKAKVESCNGLLLGSPTFNQDALKPVWDLLSVVCPINVRGKFAAVFGSYGWSGEAVKMLEERLKGLKFRVIESGLRFNFAPSNEDLKVTADFAKKFIETLKC